MTLLKNIRTALLVDPRIKDVDKRDVERVRNEDWFIDRFIQKRRALNEKLGVSEITASIFKSLLWRKEFGVNDMRGDLLPQELYDHGQMLVGLIGDEVVTITRAKYRRIISGWEEVTLNQIIYGAEYCTKTYQRSAISILDCSDVGFRDIDLGFMYRVSKLLAKNYPSLVKKVIYHNLPSVIIPVFHAACRLIPQKYQPFLELTNAETLPLVMGGIQNVPKILGGTMEVFMPPVPPGSRTLEEVGRDLNISNKDIEKMRAYIDSIQL